jgi:hypothetical protein
MDSDNKGAGVVVISATITTLNQLTNPEAVKLFPNPSKGEITFTMEGPGYTAIRIYEESGRQIYNQNMGAVVNSTVQINLGNQPDGTYIVQLQTLSGSIYRRLTIIK